MEGGLSDRALRVLRAVLHKKFMVRNSVAQSSDIFDGKMKTLPASLLGKMPKCRSQLRAPNRGIVTTIEHSNPDSKG
jgi:hypothetical protein